MGESMVGAALGAYRILRLLGRGGMGVVYEAQDTHLQRHVALKMLPAEMAVDPERLARFEREARALAALNHPNIVTIHTVEEIDDVHFMTMELIEGQTLAALIPPTGLPLARILDLALPLTQALAAAHEHDIVHRDLKPANVMVSDQGLLKVLDFGLAKPCLLTLAPGAHADELTTQNRILGTLPYMSPEQLQGAPLDQRSDIFSFGIVLHEMASGERPFRSTSSLRLAESLSGAAAGSPDGVSRQLGGIIRRCLEWDPQQRIGSAQDVHDQLHELKVRLDTDAQQITLPRRSRPVAARRPRRLLLAGAAVATAALATGGLWLWQEARPPATTADVAGRQRPRIVVLPFESVGAPADADFAAGVTEELTSRLAAVSGLRVISRRSAMRYAGAEKSMRQIATELNVEYALAGTVRWARSAGGQTRVRIAPQLIRVSDDTHVWAEVYERVVDDVFDVQTDIATRVIQQLGMSLKAGEYQALATAPTRNPEAYQAFLRGRTIMVGPDEERNADAVRFLRHAVELDPGFAAAWALLSRAHGWAVLYGFDRSPERKEQALLAARHAQELAPDSAQAHLALGYYHYHVHKNYEQAHREFTIAARALPNDSDVLGALAFIQRRQGRWDESLASLDKALRLSPLDAGFHLNQGYTMMLTRRYAEAERHFNQAVALAPSDATAYAMQAWNHLLGAGATTKARAALEAMPSPGNDPTPDLAWWQQEMLERRYRRALDRLAAMPQESFRSAVWLLPKALLAGMTHGLLDEEDLAHRQFDAARRFLEEKVQANPDDFTLYSKLGLAYAGLGRKNEALEAGVRATRLYPVSEDAVWATDLVVDLAQIYTMLGEHEAAVDEIEKLLAVPAAVSVPLLRIDPAWDPLRRHPRFKKLLQR